MIDWAKILNVIIEKAGFVSLLIATIAFIIFYKIVDDVLWSIAVWCTTYIALLGTYKLVSLIKNYIKEHKREIEKQEKQVLKNQERYSQCSLFYKTLPEDIQMDLITVYSLPRQEYENCRIITCNSEEDYMIVASCEWLQHECKNEYIDIKQCLDSNKYIITIDEGLYKVISDNN